MTIAILSGFAPVIDDSRPFVGCGGCTGPHSDEAWFPDLRWMQMMGLQHLGYTAIEAFDHAIGLRVAWRNQAMLNVLLSTGTIKNVLS